jgi:hypothetical protein
MIKNIIFLSEMRGDKNKDEDSEVSDSKKRKYTEDGRAKARERFTRDESGGGGGGRDPDEQLAAPPTPGGFGRRPKDDYEDEDEEEGDRRRKLASTRRTSGCKRLIPGGVRLSQWRPRLKNLSRG